MGDRPPYKPPVNRGVPQQTGGGRANPGKRESTRCGGKHEATNCPYLEYECHKCKKKGHLARRCRQRGHRKMQMPECATIVLYDKLTRTKNPSVSLEPSSSIHPYSGEAPLELRTCKSPQSCLENPWFHLPRKAELPNFQPGVYRRIKAFLSRASTPLS